MIKHVLKTLVAVLAIATAAAGPARAQSNHTKYTSAVAMSALQVGDTLAEGFSLTGNDANTIYFVANRHKNNENLFGSQESINLEWIQSIGANCVFSTHPYNEDYTTTFAPVDENGRDGDAWVVTEVENIAGFTYLTIAGIRIPGPLHTVTFAEGTEDAANWTVTPAEALTTGIMSGSQLTATYAGDLKVKEVIATKHLEPNEVPLTIEALTAGTVVVREPQSGMKYTLNGGAKTAMTGAQTVITVAVGDKVAFYGNGTSITSYFGTTIGGFNATAEVKAYGNIMSLVDENGFATATTLTANAAFSYLFSEYANLKDISGLLLPATTLTESCYATMFYNCTGLTTVPSDLLPATTLAEECYQQMFYDCTGLTTVPSDLLPATTLASRCYVAMFGSCENLTNVPTLPATTLAELCYNNMFLACNGLTTVPTDLLPATTLAPSCYSYMFLNCSNLTTAPALPATTLAEKCYQSMFANCTTLAASPVLPATTLAEKCYQQMFYDCENLATVPDTLPATTLASYCYQQMFYGCQNLAASPVLPATTLTNYCYQEMFKNCYNLSSVTCLATSGINQNSSTEYWLDRAGDLVLGTKTFVANPYILWPEGDSGIPEGWTRKNPDGSDWTLYNVPLTIEALTAGTVKVQGPRSGMQYTLNGGDKTPMTESPTEITVAVGDKVAFYGDGTNITRYDGTVIGGGTAEVKAYGNIMSLVNETGFDTATTLTAHTAFSSLFDGYANLKDISGLKLPATTLTMGCYMAMFYHCNGLTTVPSDLLPATTLAERCYGRMFASCANLTNVPTLPATTLAMECYDDMFSFCTGITTVPTNLLPATTLAERCYNSMFTFCINLTTAPVLPATTLVESCYGRMFYNCFNLSSVTCLATSGINQNSSTESWLDGAGSNVQGTKTVNADPNATWPEDNDNGIPSGWTRQNIDN